MLTCRYTRSGAHFVALALLLGAAACGERAPANRVLLVGIDGATMRVIGPMMQAGRLPTLASIAREGVHGEMLSYPPLKSPRIWTSIATGKRPAKHGIRGFTRRKDGGGRRLVNSRDRLGHALWNMVSDEGLRVAVVNWWATYPPERINGVVVTDHTLPSVVEGRMKYFRADSEDHGPVVYPAEWMQRVAGIVARRTLDDTESGPLSDALLLPRALHEKLSAWYLDDAIVGAIALEVEAALRPDVLMVFFKGVDPASHVLFATVVPAEWTSRRPEGTPAQLEAGAELLRRFYEQTDQLLGRLVRRFGPDDLVLVVSDHGFEVRQQHGGLMGAHDGPVARQAIVFARGRGIERGVGMPVAEDMDGSPATFLIDPGIARIATYDTGQIERVETDSAGSEKRILEQLEALGYFETNDAGATMPLRTTP